MKNSVNKTTQSESGSSAAKENRSGMSLPAVSVLHQKEAEEPIQEFPVQQKTVDQLSGSTGDETQSKPLQLKSNDTGMPDQLKSGVESLSGMSMDHVKVHYNSSQPAQLNALAYAQGSDIHIGPGQEKHLPHEAWHVVQQAQGRVQPTRQMKAAVPVNDDPGLEHEADVMGAKAMTQGATQLFAATYQSAGHVPGVLQKVAVETVTPDHVEPAKLPASQAVSQCVSVGILKKIPEGSKVSEELLQTAINEMQRIVEVAEQAEGKENSGTEHKRLQGILANSELQKNLPGSSNTTYGLGGSNYFGNTPFTTTQGPEHFGEAVSGVTGIGKTEHLGNRETGKHDEIHQITHYPGLQALASTQGHCFFCYGTIHGRGYQHGALRDTDPWPQDWQHDYLGFKLKKTSQTAESIAHFYDPAIKITSDTKGTRYYFVSVA